MNRRSFISRIIKVGAALGTAYSFPSIITGPFKSAGFVSPLPEILAEIEQETSHFAHHVSSSVRALQPTKFAGVDARTGQLVFWSRNGRGRIIVDDAGNRVPRGVVVTQGECLVQYHHYNPMRYVTDVFSKNNS